MTLAGFIVLLIYVVGFSIAAVILTTLFVRVMDPDDYFEYSVCGLEGILLGLLWPIVLVACVLGIGGAELARYVGHKMNRRTRR